MSTEATQQMVNNSNIGKSDNNMNCTPRNALFCCSSPVCLNSANTPKIVPVDYQQSADGLLLVPNSAENRHMEQQQNAQDVIVPISDANFQKRISTYDFPIFCENELSMQPKHTSTAKTAATATATTLSPQISGNLSEGAKPIEKLKTSSSHNQENESNSSTFNVKNDLQSKVMRSPSSSMSLSSSSSSASPPTPNVQAPQSSKRSSSKAINELVKILSNESLLNSNRNRNVQHTEQKYITNCKYPPDKENICAHPLKAVETTQKLNPTEKKKSTNGSSKLPLSNDSSDLYSAEIDYMNNYLRSLPDYSELDKKIYKEFQKCEDIYDQIQNLNSGITAQNQQPLSKSSSHQSLAGQFSFPPHTMNPAASAPQKALPEQVQVDRPLVNASAKPAYPSIFSANRNKLTRSVSSSNMPTHTQNYPIDHPDIPGFLPKLPQKVSGNIFQFNQGIKKSSSNSCLGRSKGIQLMNEFWSENLVDKNKKKTGWDYQKIMAATPTKENKDSNEIKTKSGFKGSNVQKDLSLSNLNSKLREDVSKEDIYKLICNDSIGSDTRPKEKVCQKIPVKPMNDIENIPGFMNLNKSVSLSNMPGIAKSGSKSHIPCYMKQPLPLNKSSSNTQLPLKQISTNQIGEGNTSKHAVILGKTSQQNQDALINPPKGILKSSSSSCIPGNKHQYQPFFLRKNDRPHNIPHTHVNNTSNVDAVHHNADTKQIKNNSRTQQMVPIQQHSNQRPQKIPQQSSFEPCKHNFTKKLPDGHPQAPSTKVSSVQISLGLPGVPQNKQGSGNNNVYQQKTAHPTAHPTSQKQCTKSQHLKAPNNVEIESSKIQKEAENNIEKCLNEMLKITSNYAPTDMKPTARTEVQQPTNNNHNKVQHKPFPIGKSNSTSCMQSCHGLKNKKLLPGWSIIDYKNLHKVTPPVSHNNHAVNATTKNVHQLPHHTQQQVYPGQRQPVGNNMPTNVQKSATSGNMYKELESCNKNGNAGMYSCNSYVIPSPAPNNSMSSSSYAPCSVRKKNSTSVGKTSTSTFNTNENQRTLINKAQNGGNAYQDDKIRSDILKTFDPYFYHRNQQQPSPLTKCNAMSNINQFADQEFVSNQQSAISDPAGQIASNQQQVSRSSINHNNRHLVDTSSIQMQQATLLGYEYPPPSFSQSSSCFDSSCDVTNPADHYFEQPKPTIQDDADGHLIYHTGDILHNRYKIMATLGEGTFGRVVKVKDMERDHCMALKIIKNVEKYREAAKLEINALDKISQKDPNCDHLCVRMLDWFDYHGHMCIAFEMLGLSVFDFLRENNYEPYPLDQVRHMGYQLCYAVKFLHDNRLTHTDLKPENILFVDSEYTTHYNHKKNREVRRVKCTDVRLIDFGSATFDHEHHSTIVSTRHYRAPEVILELGWSQPCDVWSIGCILFELYLGITLFQTHDNREHLAMMERILGQIPYRMARKTKTKYFYHGKLDWDEKSSAGRYVRDHCKPLFRYLMSDSEDHVQLFDLIKKMLEYEPSQRITLGEALRHPFFEKLPPHQRLGETGKMIMSGSSSRERSHSLSR